MVAEGNVIVVMEGSAGYWLLVCVGVPVCMVVV